MKGFVFVNLLLESIGSLRAIHIGTCIKFSWMDEGENITYGKFPLSKEPTSGLERPINILEIVKEVC